MPKPTIERSTTQAEEMRQQRNQEVRQLIGSSVNNAKAIFAQNTAAGQLTSKVTKTAPVKPVRNSITRSASSQQQQSQSQSQQQESPEPDQIQQQQYEPSLEPSENNMASESIDTTVQPSTNKPLQQEPLADVHHLEDDNSDPYSTIKRSPYTKAMPPNNHNEANGNGQQAQTTPEHTMHDTQPFHGTGNVNGIRYYFISLIAFGVLLCYRQSSRGWTSI